MAKDVEAGELSVFSFCFIYARCKAEEALQHRNTHGHRGRKKPQQNLLSLVKEPGKRQPSRQRSCRQKLLYSSKHHWKNCGLTPASKDWVNRLDFQPHHHHNPTTPTTGYNKELQTTNRGDVKDSRAKTLMSTIQYWGLPWVQGGQGGEPRFPSNLAVTFRSTVAVWEEALGRFRTFLTTQK